MLWCETHDTCKCVEQKDIPPCKPLRMVWLSMNFVELGLANEDLYDLTNSSLCALKFECLSDLSLGYDLPMSSFFNIFL